MSINCTSWVWKYGPKVRAQRYVLLAIADAANKDGEHSHPGIDTIVEYSLYSRAQVTRIIDTLISEGWLEVQEKRSPGKATTYRVVMDGESKVLTMSTQECSPGRAVESAHSEVQSAHFGSQSAHFGDPAPYIDTSTVSTTVFHNASERVTFADFWNVYPRKAEKRAAEKAWKSATARAPAISILDGAQRYRNDPNRVDAFTKHPASWLNADCWSDEPLPPRRGNSREDNTVANLSEFMGRGERGTQRNGGAVGTPQLGISLGDR